MDSSKSLGSFGVESHTPGDTAVARSATITEPPEGHKVGPWEVPSTEYGVQTRRLTGPQRTPSGPRVQPYHVRWVVGGEVTEYVEEHGEDSVATIPSTYDAMDEMSPMIKRVDSLVPGKHYGWGISGTAIERAFRVLSGGGRYKASHWRVLPCGNHPWLLTGPDGTALCSLVPVNRQGEPFATSELGGPGPKLDVEEQNQYVLDGMRRFRSQLNAREVTLVDHDCPEANSSPGFDHRFTSDDDHYYKIDAETLATLAQIKTDQSQVEVPESSPWQGPGNRAVSLDEWSGSEYEVGAVVDDKILAGFQFEWDNPEETPEVIATVASYWLENSYSSSWTLERRVDRLSTWS